MGRRFFIVLLIAIGVITSGAWARRAVQPTVRAMEYNNRGAALINQGKLTEAEFQLKTAIQLSPDYSEAYNNLGIVNKQLQRYPQALDYFEKAYKLDKSFVSPLSHMGAVYIAQGKYDAAVKSLKKAIRKDPTFTYAVYNLGLAYLLQAREAKTSSGSERLYAKSEEQFLVATQLNPHFFEAHINLGDLYAETKRYEEASIRYRLAINDNKGDPRAYEGLARVEAARGDQKAAKQFEHQARNAKKSRSVKQHFDEGVRFANEGEALRADGKHEAAQLAFDRAAQAFQAALKKEKAHLESHYGLGVVENRRGNRKAARRAWDQVLKLMPQHPGALYNLGTMAFEDGRSSEGLYYWCQFLQLKGYQFIEQHRVIESHFRQEGLQCPN